MKLIPNFTHTIGAHCGSTAMRDLLRYIGLDYSEAVCFGLGSGLGFYYFRDPRNASPARAFYGRTINFERETCAHLGLDFEEGTDDDTERAWRVAKKFVDRAIPVLLHVELSQLPYYNTQTPFPGHRVVLVGYDDARRIAMLADQKFHDLQEIACETLQTARTAKIPPIPLNNEWLAITGARTTTTLADAIRAALRDNARGMVIDRAPHQGVMGMETLAEDFENWGDSDDWAVCARFGYQNIEVRGTGGSCFRKMYAQFLREANLARLADTMEEIAREWSAFAQILNHIAQKKERAAFADASRAIRRLAMREENFWGQVLDTTS